MTIKRNKWSRLICLLTALCLFAAALPPRALALDYEVESICGGYIRVNRYTGVLTTGASLSGDLVIPEKIHEVRITAIGDRAFYDFDGLTSVTVPSSIQSIGSEAFFGCDKLRSVSVPSSVQMTVGDQAFASCVLLKTVKLGEGVTRIGKNAFRYCYDLTDLSLPSTLTAIEGSAFDSCLALKTVKIPSGVRQLGNNAFSNCASLTSVSLPDTVSSVGEYCFSGCAALKEINLPAGLPTIPTAMFDGCASLEQIIVLDGAQSIDSLAFRGCRGLRRLSLPDSVKSLAANAFDDCDRANMTFYVNAGSLAQAFAAANNIKFELGTLDQNPGPVDPGPDTYPETPFADVKTHWAKSYIEWAYAKGYFSGKSASMFAPDDPMNRGMLVTVLYNMEGTPAAGKSSFNDVPEKAYYAKAVAWAENAKVVSGMGEGKFLPTRNITREQLATMLYNYAVYKGKNVSARGDLSQFKDNGKVSAYAGTSMAWAVGSGIISGMGNSELNPKGNATRAQATVMLRKLDSLK